MGSQQFCLKWNNHQSNLLNVFDQLLQNEAFVDVTLACEGLSLKAHKMVLSACSPYFQTLFLENPCKHPIVILNSVRYSELKAIVDFMYKGEVNVSQEQLSLLLKTAEMLKVKGLAEVTNQTAQSLNANASDPILSVPSVSPPPSQLLSNHNHRRNGSPPPKRKKVRANPSSSAASSPQSNTLTNYNASKNSTDQAMMALDQSNDSHLPLESKICKEENTDQCMMDLPPKLIMEPAAELVDDQSSMSNITSDMPSYDPTKGDTSVPDLSSPPDITSSNIQSIPSTSGLQGANQDGTLSVNCEMPVPYIADEELKRLKEQTGNIKQFATTLAKLFFSREERRECNTYTVGKRKGLDANRVHYLRQLVLTWYQVPQDAWGDVWSQCVTAINAHCRYLRWKERFDTGFKNSDGDEFHNVYGTGYFE